jgi:hypothetical protein
LLPASARDIASPNATKIYWQHVAEPIKVMSPAQRRKALLMLRAASAVGRFYRRR